jgi:hypothetical protein
VGRCIYCGQPAGFLRNKHRECTEKHNQGWKTMIAMAQKAILSGTAEGLEDDLAAVAEKSFIPQQQVKEALLAGWDKAIGHYLDDGFLDEEEEKQLVSFTEHFGFTQSDLDKKGSYTRFIQGAVLHDLMEGKTPQRFRIDGIPFNFQKSESLIWGFNNVDYYEDKTRRQYVSGSQGVSFRIAKGVYYRVGGFRGHPVETTERVYVDKGMLAVTTKHLYFGGNKKSFRVRLDKIVSFIPFSNGIGIQRDAASAKPQYFITGDGWFIYNLLTNVSHIGN